MPPCRPAALVLDREFLEIRAKLLELAACFDRLDRGGGALPDDARMKRIREALDVLRSAKEGRAEALQLIFSRTYEQGWQSSYGVRSRP